MPCTTLLVGRRASNDGSTMIARTDDGHFDHKKIIVVKPEGQPRRYKSVIGKLELDLAAGDTFYLSSDGYIDQFGGKYGRKFLSRNFVKLLMDINDKPMAEQEKIVIETHDNWRGLEYDQLDDIIVIGVRV